MGESAVLSEHNPPVHRRGERSSTRRSTVRGKPIVSIIHDLFSAVPPNRSMRRGRESIVGVYTSYH